MSKRTRALIRGSMVAAMNLAAMTAVAQAQANDQPPPGGRPPKARSGSPGTSVSSPAEQPNIASDALERLPHRKPKSEKPGATPDPTPPPAQPAEPGGLPSGSWLRSGCWPPSWRRPAGWPCWLPGGPAGGAWFGHAA